MDKIIDGVFETKKQDLLNEKELTDITVAIIKEFENQSMQEIVIYR